MGGFTMIMIAMAVLVLGGMLVIVLYQVRKK